MDLKIFESGAGVTSFEWLFSFPHPAATWLLFRTHLSHKHLGILHAYSCPIPVSASRVLARNWLSSTSHKQFRSGRRTSFEHASTAPICVRDTPPDGTQLRCDITPMDAHTAQARVGDVVRAVARHKSQLSASCTTASLPSTPRSRAPPPPCRTAMDACPSTRYARTSLSTPSPAGAPGRHCPHPKTPSLPLAPLPAADPEFTFANGSDGALSGVLDEYSPTLKSLREFGRASSPASRTGRASHPTTTLSVRTSAQWVSKSGTYALNRVARLMSFQATCLARMGHLRRGRLAQHGAFCSPPTTTESTLLNGTQPHI
ncbi:hypothetical protein DFH08DRAFT_885021 [Mycena albidolilacea]|uniref:Uncharacterized protein n=1 Tax=Mycena albidolilacea TaxID=1033008 RepID=A0AAD7EIA1_9AGAR|nr:hypothetical protein DFH08DRAFT_885021 [Mycena albidolilacea]